MMATGKEYNSFWQRSPNKDDWCDALENLEETVREEYVYGNCLLYTSDAADEL